MLTKPELAEWAREHTKLMSELYAEQIELSIANTVTYGGEDAVPSSRISSISRCKAGTVQLTALQAALSLPGSAVLNFASYKGAGGRFLDGSFAQEEALCHDSYLYNVLSRFESCYAYNRCHLNYALYTDRALFSPNIVFADKRGNASSVSVITCAAPNWRVARRQGISYADNVSALTRRVDFVIDIAQTHNIDTLVLGAWGCGVFCQDPAQVAQAFYDRLRKGTTLSYVIFAIPERNAAYAAFAKYFMDMNLRGG